MQTNPITAGELAHLLALAERPNGIDTYALNIRDRDIARKLRDQGRVRYRQFATATKMQPYNGVYFARNTPGACKNDAYAMARIWADSSPAVSIESLTPLLQSTFPYMTGPYIESTAVAAWVDSQEEHSRTGRLPIAPAIDWELISPIQRLDNLAGIMAYYLRPMQGETPTPEYLLFIECSKCLYALLIKSGQTTEIKGADIGKPKPVAPGVTKAELLAGIGYARLALRPFRNYIERYNANTYWPTVVESDSIAAKYGLPQY